MGFMPSTFELAEKHVALTGFRGARPQFDPGRGCLLSEEGFRELMGFNGLGR
jgi:hypothetical protein